MKYINAGMDVEDFRMFTEQLKKNVTFRACPCCGQQDFNLSNLFLPFSETIHMRTCTTCANVQLFKPMRKTL